MGSRLGVSKSCQWREADPEDLIEPHRRSIPEKLKQTEAKNFPEPRSGGSVSAPVNFQTHRHRSAAAAAPRGRPTAAPRPPPVSSNRSRRGEPIRMWRDRDRRPILSLVSQLPPPPSWSGQSAGDVTGHKQPLLRIHQRRENDLTDIQTDQSGREYSTTWSLVGEQLVRSGATKNREKVLKAKTNNSLMIWHQIYICMYTLNVLSVSNSSTLVR